MNRDGVSYAGPGREPAFDLPGDRVTIGVILPLQGAHEAAGRALLEAAQIALDEEAASPLPGGRRLVLAARDESGPWGQASSEIVRLIYEDQAVALVTSQDGNIAHQAEQVANKIGVPLLTLSSDATTTEINLPWIFRVGPSDADEARAFAQHIYRQRAFKSVLLVAQADHDGRVGSEEFEKAARRLDVPAPRRLEIPPAPADSAAVLAQLQAQSPDAVVLWTEPASAARLVPLLRQAKSSAAVYLSRKASSFAVGGAEGSGGSSTVDGDSQGEIWVTAAPSMRPSPVQQDFARRFLARTGTMPSSAAAGAYDAVHIIAAAVRRAGPNRVRLRDELAAGAEFPGVTRNISFDSAGNDRSDIVVVPLRGSPNAAAHF
jgi:branched-chain amino acid transport system substrate-binding protein